MDTKIIRRQKLRFRIRKKVTGTAVRPRLSVFRSNKDIYAQIIDDATGKTLVYASSRAKDIASQKVNKTEKAKLVGAALAQSASAKGITQIAFDRNGYLYHGRVKAIAEGAREGGLQF